MNQCACVWWGSEHNVSQTGPRLHLTPAVLAPTSCSCLRHCIRLELGPLLLDPITSHGPQDPKVTILTQKYDVSSLCLCVTLWDFYLAS